MTCIIYINFLSHFLGKHHINLGLIGHAVSEKMFENNYYMAEDIYTAAWLECMYQNGYVHGSPSRFSAKSAIYTAAGCQHIIAIHTAAVPEQV